MAQINEGRFTADLDGDEVVVFLIGMRVNKPWRIHKWWPVFTAMPKMLRYLAAHPEKGLLGYRQGATFMVQYWRSFEDLDRFARDRDDPHLEPWRRYVREVGNSGDVGIWHETFRAKVGDIETIYTNMPTAGLAKFSGGAVPVARKGQSAAKRIGYREVDDVAVPVP
ncbi:MAG TPA: DUF4188 domain-containing protein [Acidimicrobiales bacterium]|jgi:hypothetical protein